MKKQFTLFQSHLDLAHRYWRQLVQPSDLLVDATCGNGQDTLFLCQLVPKGHVYAMDIQPKAIELTRNYLTTHEIENVSYHLGCHSQFPETIHPESVTLFTYNLGYLPGGNKELTTQVFTTLESIKKGQQLLKPGGILSITCYPGHEEGAREQDAVLAFAKDLDPKEWNCCFHQWLNRQKAPGLLLIQKACEPNPTTFR